MISLKFCYWCAYSLCLKHERVHLCLGWCSIMAVIKCCHLVFHFENIFFKLGAASPMHGRFWHLQTVNSNFTWHRRGLTVSCFRLDSTGAADAARVPFSCGRLFSSSCYCCTLCLQRCSLHVWKRMRWRIKKWWEKSDAGCSTCGAGFFFFF